MEQNTIDKEFEVCNQMMETILRITKREKTKDFMDGFLMGWSQRTNLGPNMNYLDTKTKE